MVNTSSQENEGTPVFRASKKQGSCTAYSNTVCINLNFRKARLVQLSEERWHVYGLPRAKEMILLTAKTPGLE